MEEEETDRLNLKVFMKPCHVGRYTFDNLHLNAIKVFHDVCGYGGEDGEKRLLSLFGNPRAELVPTNRCICKRKPL